MKLKNPTWQDEKICRALCKQVANAAAGGSEASVTTVITASMYRCWERWTGVRNSAIYGSRVILIEGDKRLMSASTRR